MSYLKIFTLHEGGTLKKCGFITYALMQRWESFLRREMQKRNGAYCFFTTFTKAQRCIRYSSAENSLRNVNLCH